MKQKFIEHRFSTKNLEKLEQVQQIVGEYQNQGLSLTLRQLYYQMVSRDFIPNSQNEYKKIADLLSDARRAGLIDWDAIEDRTRSLSGYEHYESPSDAVIQAARGYGIDLLADQDVYLECWVEKDALKDLVGRACGRYDVNYFSCRGFASDSEVYKAGRRLRYMIEMGKTVTILHLGDHDPSGIDMSRDILERLELFGEIPNKIDFRRIALNMDQIRTFNPPPNPAKDKDTRYQSYVEKYGPTSWELDALEPSVFMNLITTEIEEIIDLDRFKARVNLESEQREQLIETAKRLTEEMRI